MTRIITVILFLFISPTVSADGAQSDQDNYQALYNMLYEGSVNKILVEEKGQTYIATKSDEDAISIIVSTRSDDNTPNYCHTYKANKDGYLIGKTDTLFLTKDPDFTPKPGDQQSFDHMVEIIIKESS